MPVLKKSAPKKQKKERMHEEMSKFKKGTLHSGSKEGPKVKDRKQAVAIAMHESGQAKKSKPAPNSPAAAADYHHKKQKTDPPRRKRNQGRS
jgi:hypothetical protein